MFRRLPAPTQADPPVEASSGRLPRPRKGRAGALLLVAIGAWGCGGGAADGAQEAEQVYDDPQILFWDALQTLCGQAFEGRVTESVPPDDTFEGRRIVMHVRVCEPGMVRIPFVVGEDRSRTWVVSTTSTGLRLKHDHRHEDGTADEVTEYGGDAEGRGEATVQYFPADAFTAGLVPAASTNVWSLELRPGEYFAYGLRREGSDRRFRVEFDLTRPVAPPPPPWGG